MARAVLVAAILAQLGLSGMAPRPAPRSQPGPAPLMAEWFSFGERALAARLTMLALQSADDRQRSLASLDYGAAAAWIDTSLKLDPRSIYPLHLATLVYAPVSDRGRCRRMLALIARHFDAAPAQRRPYLEAAVGLARHHLHDPQLAAELQAKLDRAQYGAAKPLLPLD